MNGGEEAVSNRWRRHWSTPELGGPVAFELGFLQALDQNEVTGRV
jgi:hypothetical protein